MNLRQIVLVVTLVVGAITLVNAYRWYDTPHVAAPSIVWSDHPAGDVLVAFVPLDDDIDEVGRSSDASYIAARPTTQPSHTSGVSSVKLDDALEGLDSTDYRMTMMLCQDLY